jgi:hypothetical protein
MIDCCIMQSEQCFRFIMAIVLCWDTDEYLWYINTFSWIFLVLTHWNNSPPVDISLHSDIRASQSLFLLLNVVCLAENQQLPIYQSLVWTERGSNTRYAPLKWNTLTITQPMRFGIKTINKMENIPFHFTSQNYLNITYLVISLLNPLKQGHVCKNKYVSLWDSVYN